MFNLNNVYICKTKYYLIYVYLQNPTYTDTQKEAHFISLAKRGVISYLFTLIDKPLQ